MAKDFVLYNHHGVMVWVQQSLKGKHREHCACFFCTKFDPINRERNCSIANQLFKLCTEYSLVTPVYECPHFEQRQESRDSTPPPECSTESALKDKATDELLATLSQRVVALEDEVESIVDYLGETRPVQKKSD